VCIVSSEFGFPEVTIMQNFIEIVLPSQCIGSAMMGDKEE